MVNTPESILAESFKTYLLNPFTILIIIFSCIYLYFKKRFKNLYFYPTYPSYNRDVPKEKEKPENKGNLNIKKNMQNFENKENLDIILKKTILPVSLIFKGDKIESSKNYFKNIENYGIEFIEASKYSEERIKSDKNSEITTTIDSKNNLIVYSNQGAYKNAINNIDKESDDSTSLVIKQIIGCLNLREDNLSLSDNFTKKFANITKGSKPDGDITKKLEKIFEENGYYIPLKIYFGGKAIIENNEKFSNTSEYSKNAIDINFTQELDGKITFDNDSKSKNTLKSSHTMNRIQFLGGDKKYFSEEKLNEWKNSISFNNCEIIEYANLIGVRNILHPETSSYLKNSLDIIEKKYALRKKYCEIIEFLKYKNYISIKGKGNIKLGVCDEGEIIKKIGEKYYKEYAMFGIRHLDIKQASYKNTKIVGYELKWKDCNNTGEYCIEKNPLLQREIICSIESKKSYPIDITLDLYCLIEPD